MKVYLAGNPRSSDCSAAMDAVRGAGHEITHDWMRATLPSRQAIAEADLAGVRACEVLILLDAERGWGMYVELGAAVALGKPVYVVGVKYRQVFFDLPGVTCVSSIEDALTLL